MGRKQSGRNYQGASSYWVTDDRSGFTVRAYNTEKEWTQARVAKELWEPRQPQDFVRGVRDDQTVYDPRPEPGPVWTGILYYSTSAASVVGATFLPLTSVAQIVAGYKARVMLDNGIVFLTSVSSVTTTGINISALPYTVASGNQVAISSS